MWLSVLSPHHLVFLTMTAVTWKCKPSQPCLLTLLGVRVFYHSNTNEASCNTWHIWRSAPRVYCFRSHRNVWRTFSPSSCTLSVASKNWNQRLVSQQPLHGVFSLQSMAMYSPPVLWEGWILCLGKCFFCAYLTNGFSFLFFFSLPSESIDSLFNCSACLLCIKTAMPWKLQMKKKKKPSFFC